MLQTTILRVTALALTLTAGATVTVDEAFELEPVAAVEAVVEVGAAERELIRSIARRYRSLATADRLGALVDAIYEESALGEVDPLLVTSIVAKESSFQTTVTSTAGAVGLMQLRPSVAGDLAARFDLEWTGAGTLHDPRANVRLGILYYKELMARFDGDAHMALTAYNFGPTRVSRQLRDGTYAGSAYASQVLSLYGRLAASRGNAA